MNGALETIRFPVTGMTCGSCVSRITRALRQVAGVDRVRVDLGEETATVRRDASTATNEALATAITAAGYAANLDAAVGAPEAELRGRLARLFGR